MKKTCKSIDNKLLIGRSEWCALRALGIPAIKAKVDTGAKTSALHAFNIRAVSENGVDYVYFDAHPIQSEDETVITCKAKIEGQRAVMSSNGHKEKRYVITTQLEMSGEAWDIELTLSNRDPLRYRMLLGREALKGRVLVDPALDCHQAKLNHTTVIKLYNPTSESDSQ